MTRSGVTFPGDSIMQTDSEPHEGSGVNSLIISVLGIMKTLPNWSKTRILCTSAGKEQRQGVPKTNPAGHFLKLI